MTDLATRLESSPPSRELDAEIARAMGWEVEDNRQYRRRRAHGVWRHLPGFTASTDAAIALVRERLPDAVVGMDAEPGRSYVTVETATTLRAGERQDRCLAAAICAAWCRAEGV
jgi:hypothetical protein